ncbi:lytic transglycosylase domain-containing protein [Lichenibacterium minor]|uniref:Lytic transglycosylase domain-containing protein n=1 Tax=Lichenibacterium minor TaxID=2316528 RepID=A0A4Q2U1N3_9HYPH|nr:lytic transglycosylase domain-containing protein [Lichenibacterium minor]
MLIAALASAGAAPRAPAAEPAVPAVDVPVCRLIEAAARGHGLPVGFLTRLIWRESSFRPAVVSPAGAQGIAQFMPGTAGERGLADPFDPEAAVPKAAELLADLRRQFGSLGLAAAAYNAGPARVADWLAGRRDLPAETRGYVLAVTGRPAEDWKDGPPPAAAASVPDRSCDGELAALRARLPALAGASALLAPWGVQLAGSFSKAAAVAAYADRRAAFSAVLRDEPPMVVGGRAPGRGFRPFYRVRFPAPSRPAAAALCGRILRLGGACSVTRS